MSRTIATETSARAAEPPPVGSQTLTLQRLRAEKFARYSLLFIVVLTGVLFFNMVKVFFVPVILAAVFAGLFHPFYEWLLKLARGRRSISAFVCCLALSLGVLLPVYGIANLVAREAIRLYQTAEGKGLRTLEANFQSFVQRHPALQSLRLETLPLQATVEPAMKKAADLLATAVNRASRETFELVAKFFLTFFTMFYFFRDGPVLVQRLKYFSPLADRYEDELIRRFLAVSRATLKGTLLVALIKGTLGGLTFWAFGLDAPVLWGVVMVFLSVLPVVGAWLVMYPAAAILLLGATSGPASGCFSSRRSSSAASYRFAGKLGVGPHTDALPLRRGPALPALPGSRAGHRRCADAPRARLSASLARVLAGDTIRSAADLKVPMVAVSLLHRKGYLSQRLDASGWQHEEPTEWPSRSFSKNSRSVCSSRFNGAPFRSAPGNMK